jgi:hypothetical protein
MVVSGSWLDKGKLIGVKCRFPKTNQCPIFPVVSDW